MRGALPQSERGSSESAGGSEGENNSFVKFVVKTPFNNHVNIKDVNEVSLQVEMHAAPVTGDIP